MEREEFATREKTLHLRKIFCRIGLCYSLYLAAAYGASFLLAWGIGKLLQAGFLASELLQTPWFSWAASFLPMYAVAFPLLLVLLRAMNIPKCPPGKQKLSFGRFCMIFCVCYATMTLGSFIGNGMVKAFSWVFHFAQPENQVLSMARGSWVWALLYAGVLAPIMEEILFRKLLLDRLAEYGEGICVLLSGMFFALFHGNFYQFFYAFGAGSIFAYVYLRTGQIRYSIGLHMLANFISGMLPMFLQEWVGKNLWILAGYGMAMFVVFICGIVFLAVYRKQLVFQKPLCPDLRGRCMKTVFFNAGMLCYIVANLVRIGLHLVSAA